MKRLTFLAPFLLLCFACATGRSSRSSADPTKPIDFLVDSKVVAQLERGEPRRFSPTQLDQLEGEHVERWKKCGAVEAAQARYQPAGGGPPELLVTVLSFGDSRGAFCGFTPGRSDRARPVLDLEGAFEDIGFARAWRAHHVVEVRGELDESSRNRALGLLRATALRLPGPLKPAIPGAAMLAENSVVAGSEHIELSGALPTVDRPALVAQVRCGEQSARSIAIEFPSADEAKAALDGYQGHALENFWEVSPYEQAGATGVRVRADGKAHLLFVSGSFLLGLVDAPGLEPCDDPVSELASRAAPLR